MADTIIKELTGGVWTFSRPFWRFGFVPVGGRSTAVRLRDGGVWVLASTPLNHSTKRKLDELGTVKYLVAPDVEHHFYIADYANSYPQAKVIGVEPLVEKKKGVVKFDGVYGLDPPDTKYGYEDEIKACYFSDFVNKDVAFLHQPSKTLIQADLLFNLPGYEQHSYNGWFSCLFKLWKFGPYDGFHKSFSWKAGKGSDQMRKDVHTVASWDFDRIIPCHGDIIEKNGNQAWRSAYARYFQS